MDNCALITLLEWCREYIMSTLERDDPNPAIIRDIDTAIQELKRR